MKGLVLNNKIVDISETEFEVHPDSFWINVPSDCVHGWEVSNGVAIRPTEQSAEEKMEHLRMTRNSMLRKTDWWVLADRNPTPEQLAYRQALREITDKYTSMDDVIWPILPE